MNRKLLLPLFLLFPGCSNLRPHDAYVRADRDTFEAIAPVVRALADEDPANDPNLSGPNSTGLLLTIDTWELRLTTAEEGLRNE